MNAATLLETRRELAKRSSAGIEVTLYWNAGDNTTSIEIWQPATEELVEFAVPLNRALDAYYHPFAHLLTTVTR